MAPLQRRPRISPLPGVDVSDEQKRWDDQQADTRPEKAYRNSRFLGSPAARELRILAEFIEPEHRFARHDVYNTVVFFGSAR